MSQRTEYILVAVIMVAFLTFCAGAISWGCERQSECMHAKCSTPGFSPVWTHRDAQCICAEVPQ